MIKNFILRKLEKTKTYDARNLILSRIGVYNPETKRVDYTKRYAFKGPFIEGERIYYQIFPTMEKINVYGQNSMIFLQNPNTHISDMFPTLRRVTKSQIKSILTQLLENDIQLGEYENYDSPRETNAHAKLSLNNKHQNRQQ